MKTFFLLAVLAHNPAPFDISIGKKLVVAVCNSPECMQLLKFLQAVHGSPSNWWKSIYSHPHSVNGPAQFLLCLAINAENAIYYIDIAKKNDYSDLIAFGGSCYQDASVKGSIDTTTSVMLYVSTTAPLTLAQFQASTCGAALGAPLATKIETEAATLTILTDKCFQGNVDHGHCGDETHCPCYVPTDGTITPLKFTMNLAHTSHEGAIYFNNFFFPAVKKNANCDFTHYRVVYGDSKATTVIIYALGAKATCTVAALQTIADSTHDVYYHDAEERYEHDHFVVDRVRVITAGHIQGPVEFTLPRTPRVLQGDHDHDHDGFGVDLAEITTIEVLAALTTIPMETCWDAAHAALECVSHDAKCTILCPLDATCTSHDDCGTGICAEESEGDDDHDHDHDHFVIQAMKMANVQMGAKDIDVFQVHHMVCQLEVNTARIASFAVAIVIAALALAF